MRAAFGFLATLTLTAIVQLLVSLAITFVLVVAIAYGMFGSLGDRAMETWIVLALVGALGLFTVDLSASLIAVLTFIGRRQFLLALGVAAGWWLGLSAAAILYPYPF